MTSFFTNKYKSLFPHKLKLNFHTNVFNNDSFLHRLPWTGRVNGTDQRTPCSTCGDWSPGPQPSRPGWTKQTMETYCGTPWICLTSSIRTLSSTLYDSRRLGIMSNLSLIQKLIYEKLEIKIYVYQGLQCKIRSAFESLNYLLIQSVSFGQISSVGR